MSATANLGLGGAAWRSSDWYASHTRRTSLVVGTIALACASLYAALILALGGSTSLLIPLVAGVTAVAIFSAPVVGVYLLLGIAILLEQFAITGLEPLTAQTRIYQNISGYTPIPLRLSLQDLLVLLTLVCWLVRRQERPRMGPLGWPVAGYAAVFVLGIGIGAARGGSFDMVAALSELHGPLTMCALYFLSANLIRDRRQLAILMWEFVILLGVKAFQGLLNNQDAMDAIYYVYSVTAHEDVVFFGLAMTLVAAMAVMRVRTRLFYALLAIQPLILGAEFVAARRAGFVALGAVLIALVLLSIAGDGRRGLALAAVSGLAAVVYAAVFWDAEGILGGPVRALRSVLDPVSMPFRDQASNVWRDIENGNIAYTMRQLPLTGVGLGQQYLFQREPTPLGFPYWRYETHNAVLWLWLKAGPLGGFALWYMVARVLLLGSSLYARLRDPVLRWVALLPVALIILQIIFSSVELGLTYSRNMIVLGAILGLTAFVVAEAARTPAQAPAAQGSL